MLRHRVVIFCHISNAIARVLLKGALGALQGRPDAEVVAICPFGEHSIASQLWEWARTGALRTAQRLLDPELPAHRMDFGPIPIGIIARKIGAEIIPVARDEGALRRLVPRLARVGPTTAINLYTPRKFPPSLLALFRSAINYHNGALPRFRGLRATHWSVYLREHTSGWSVHHMTGELDAGNVLASGAIPITDGCGIAGLEREKAEQALAERGAWLERWLGGDPGVPQSGEARLFTRADYAAVTRVASPGQLSAAEWRWRVRCFSRVWAFAGGEWIPVTRLLPVQELHRGEIGWRCADGTCLRVARADFLPPALYRATSERIHELDK